MSERLYQLLCVSQVISRTPLYSPYRLPPTVLAPCSAHSNRLADHGCNLKSKSAPGPSYASELCTDFEVDMVSWHYHHGCLS